jgi:hypothetical protein
MALTPLYQEPKDSEEIVPTENFLYTGDGLVKITFGGMLIELDFNDEGFIGYVSSVSDPSAGTFDSMSATHGDLLRFVDDNQEDEEPDFHEVDYPDYGPPGSGAVIIEYTGFEPGLWPEEDF